MIPIILPPIIRVLFLKINRYILIYTYHAYALYI